MSEPQDRRLHAESLRRHDRLTRSQRLKRHALVMLCSVALGGLAAPWLVLDARQLQASGIYMHSSLLASIAAGSGDDPEMTLRYPDGDQLVSARAVASHPYFRNAAGTAIMLANRGMILGFAGWALSFGLLRRAAARRRAAALRDRVVSGTIVTSEVTLAKMVADGPTGHLLAIGPVPFPARLETRHMAMIGTTGSGKTTVLRQMLDGIEARGEAALVYDTSGEFIANYYDPARGDIILNPFDARCAFWSPFAEIAHPADADRIAQQLISETGQHDRDVWLETSRILVANMLRALWREGRGTLTELLHALQVQTAAELKVWLGDSSSARTFADDADRATGSVLFMLAKAANLIQFLRMPAGNERPFSFRDFIAGIDDRAGPRPWIFVPRKEDYFEASRPLLACWLECAASAMLGLSPSASRRVWFLLDELADLPAVDNLARLLPEGRKFGAAVILTFQGIGQMRSRYGRDISESMLGCCNTKLFLQLTDAESRRWASDTIGTCEVEIHTMTGALGEKGDPPRITLGKQRTIRPAIHESELRLPRHKGYLLFPDGLPVALISLRADHIAKRGEAGQPPFVPADPGTTLWHQSGRSLAAAEPRVEELRAEAAEVADEVPERRSARAQAGVDEGPV